MLVSENKAQSVDLKERESAIAALRALGLVALPVAPATEQGDKKFSGKSPSFINKNGKTIAVKHSKYHNWDSEEVGVDDSWFGDPSVGVGTLGSNHVIWLDLDKRDGMSQEEVDGIFYSLLEKNPVLESAWLEQTQSGGYRLGFRVAEEVESNFLWCLEDGKRLGEVRGRGAFSVLAPTIGVSGGLYKNINRPSELPGIVKLEQIGVYKVGEVKKQTTNSFDFDDPKHEDLSGWGLEDPDPTDCIKSEIIEKKKGVFLWDCVTAENHLALMEGITNKKDKSEAFTKALKDLFGWENWLAANNINAYGSVDGIVDAAAKLFEYDSEKVDRIKKSIKIESCIPAAKYKGGDEACWKKVNALVKKEERKHKKPKPPLSEEQIAQKIAENKEITKDIASKLNMKIKYDPESGNMIGDYIPKAIKIALEMSDLKFNEMTQEIEFCGKPVDLSGCYPQMILESECALKAGKEKAVDLITMVAKTMGSYHPVRDYLKNLPPAEDSSFLNDLATRYLGNNDPLANIYLRKTLIGAVERVLNPGSKMDTMCILYGSQGIGKSTFWSELVSVLPGKLLFTDSLQDLSNKDELAKLRRFWNLELAEIDFLFSTKAKEQFKRFLSAPDDTYRPPYARSNQTVPRTCFFTGSTNRKELLSDESGSRRFWIIECLCKKIPTKLLKEERDKIWAAAYRAVLEGELCYLTDDEQSSSNEANKAFQDVDPWLSIINDYVTTNHYYTISTAAVYKNAVNMNEDRWDKKSSNRIGAIMRTLGYDYKTKRENGACVKVWVKPLETPKPEPEPEIIDDAIAPEVEVIEAPPLTGQEVAEAMEVEEIADYVRELKSKGCNDEYFDEIFCYLEIAKRKELESKFPDSFSVLRAGNEKVKAAF